MNKFLKNYFFHKLLFLFLFISVVLIVSMLSGFTHRIIDYSYITKDTNSNEDLSGSITLNGSTSMTPLSNSLGEKFTDLHPNISVDKSDTGSGAAITSVLNSVAFIGDISRDLHPSELSDKIDIVTIAFDGISVIVNKSNPLTNISDHDVKRIFSGEIDNWVLLGWESSNITLVGREESSGTRSGFEQAFNLKDKKCPYSVELPESGDVLAKVSNDKSAIGYISIASISENTKALKINSISPTIENILNGSYIAKRPFNQIYLKIHKDDSKIVEWFNFVFSSIGEEIITRLKLIPSKSP